MLTLSAVQKALDDAVALKGEDYVYPSSDCAYSTNPALGEQAPSCIVGYVLNALEPEVFKEVAKREWQKPDPSLGVYVDEYGYALDSTTVEGLRDRWGIRAFDDVEDGVVELLYEAQSNQDSGNTWGSSVALAREYLERRADGSEV